MCYWVFWGVLVPYGYLGGRSGGAASVSTLGGGVGVCTGDGGGAGREVAGRSPLELLGGSPLEQVGCCVAVCNMMEVWA